MKISRFLLIAISLNLCFGFSLAKTVDKNSPLYIDEITKKQLRKAKSLISNHNSQRANELLNDVLNNANSVDKCLTIVKYTKDFGYPFIDIRRQCLEKALKLAQSESDILQVTKIARSFDFYEVTKEAISNLLAKENTPQSLYDLCVKCQEFALNDIAQLGMKKAFNLIDTVQAGIEYANKAKAFGMDDLCHKMLKALVDDDNSTRSLCVLLTSVQSFEMPDINRYLLKKALDESSTVQDYAMVWDASRKLGQADLQDLAAYRGKKLQLMMKIKQDQNGNNSVNDNSNF